MIKWNPKTWFNGEYRAQTVRKAQLETISLFVQTLKDDVVILVGDLNLVQGKKKDEDIFQEKFPNASIEYQDASKLSLDPSTNTYYARAVSGNPEHLDYGYILKCPSNAIVKL